MTVPYPRHSPAFLRIRNAVRPFVTEQPTVIGLSGGADSLALVAAALVEGAQVHSVVVDHQLQEGSDVVAQRATDVASRWGAHATVIPVVVSGGGGMEAAARQARYAALTSFGKPVWTAHTMDDQAETYLLGALRGNPTGIAQESCISGVRIVRPLLGVRRADTVQACTELGVEAWQDPHNDSFEYRRVRIRHEVLPLLNDIIGGDSIPAIAQAATRAHQANETITSLADPFAPISQLRSMPVAVRHESIAGLIRSAVGKVSQAALQQVDDLVMGWKGQGPVAIGGGSGVRIWIRRSGDQLVVEEQ
ncbi:tRNA lysidine(34) synthetase TilS [Corynebacterium hindlerae]|uniref:tRNA(Ile)-lysidine synthase n=1 Tax=Corynebacterium hindlerae TaxID=699041 RepID=A0A7G5FD86_9CORY|nr:tRNA lysidine(34) synthetase TilS [Corynebacterium hindlerae]QMV84577.1 tRNA lysidine(34) synthetase TilS [Corynebacterium hindlerae]